MTCSLIISGQTVMRVVNHMNTVRAGSDHNVIAIMMRMKDRVICRQEIMKRMRKNMNSLRAQQSMRNVDWLDLFKSNYVNIVNNILETKILEVLDKEAPMKVVQVRRNYRKWVNNDLRGKMKERECLSERCTGDRDIWKAYSRKINEVTKETKKCKN